MTIIRCEYENVIYDLDVLESTPIRLDISAIENNDIGEIYGAASQAFTLPGSKKNNRFFKHAYKVGSTAVPGLNESVRCWLISESDTLLEGSLYLDSVVKTANEGVNYEVTIVNNVITFNEAIKTTRVKDLNWSSYQHSLSMINITASWDNELFGGDIFYPLIDQGRDGQETTGSLPNVAIDPSDTPAVGYMNNTTTPIQANQFTPAVRVRTVLDKIFEAGNFKYETSLLDLFNNTYILPKQTETLAVKGGSFSDYGIIVSKGGSPDLISGDNQYNVVELDTETYDPTNSFNTSTYTYTIPRTGTYQLSGSLQYGLDQEDTSPIVRLRIRNTTTNTNLGFTYSEPTEILGTIGVEGESVNLTSGDEIQLQVAYSQGGGQGQLDLEIYANGTNLQTLETPINWETGIVQMGEQFDPQVKCIDIIKGLAQKFNLIFEPDYTKNRVINIETYNNWLATGNRKDWTDKIQNAERIFLKSPLSSQPKTLEFQDAKDNDKLSKQVIDNAEGLQWGTAIVDAISDVPQGEKKVGEYFAPIVLERLPGGDANNVIPQLYKTDDTQEERKTFKFKPRIGYKVNGTLPQTAYIGGNITPFTNYATISNYDSIPIVSNSTKNLHWNDSFYPPTFTSTTGSITAYDEYWSNYVNDLYREDNKILKADIYFEPYELRNIKLNDAIFVEDSYYRINKISGYNVNNPDVVSVELIGLSSGELPSVDINCNFDFNWGETTTTTTLIPPVQPTTSTTTAAPTTTTTSTTTSGTTTTTTAGTTTTTTSGTTTTTTAGTTTTTTAGTTTTTTAGTTTTTTAGTTTTTTAGPTTTTTSTTTTAQDRNVQMLVVYTASVDFTEPDASVHQRIGNNLWSGFNLNISGSVNGVSRADTQQVSVFDDTLEWGSGIGNAPWSINEPYWDQKTENYISGALQNTTNYYGVSTSSRQYPYGWGGDIKNWTQYFDDTNRIHLTASVELTPSINRTLTLYDISGSNGYTDAWMAFNAINDSGTIAHQICILPISQSAFWEPSSTPGERQKVYTYDTSSCSTIYTDNIPDRRFYVGEFNGERIVVNYKTETYNSSSNVYVERMNPVLRSPLIAAETNNVGTGVDYPNCQILGTDGVTKNLYWDDNENIYYGYDFPVTAYTPVYTNEALTEQYCGASGTGRFFKVQFVSGSRAGDVAIASSAKTSVVPSCYFNQITNLDNCN